MSKFLGPIHHWLHSKIMLQEAMEVATEQHLSSLGYSLDALSTWNERYGAPNPSENLESVIAQDNIHGWLQHRISFAETRFAGKVTTLAAAHGSDVLNEIQPIFEQFASETARQLLENGVWDNSLQSAHKLLHNQILEGMPCDHAGAVTINEENLFQWRSDRCLHQGYWVAVDGDAKHHYVLRDAFNGAFLKSLGGLSYARTEQNGSTYYQIQR